MSTAEVFKLISDRTGIHSTDVKKVIDNLANILEDRVLNNGEKTGVGALGFFRIKLSKERKGRNPVSNTTIVIPAKEEVKWVLPSNFKRVKKS